MVDAVITVPDDDKGSRNGAIDKCLEIADEVISVMEFEGKGNAQNLTNSKIMLSKV